MGWNERRMRVRWQTVSGLWESYKQLQQHNLNLLRSARLHSQTVGTIGLATDPRRRPYPLGLYSSAGEPTAAIIHDDNTLIDNVLFWITCKNLQDTSRSQLLAGYHQQPSTYDAVTPLMPKGQFGARHLHKHLWKLPIPEFDPRNRRHVAIAKAGEAAAQGAAQQLERVTAAAGQGYGDGGAAGVAEVAAGVEGREGGGAGCGAVVGGWVTLGLAAPLVDQYYSVWRKA